MKAVYSYETWEGTVHELKASKALSLSNKAIVGSPNLELPKISCHH